MPEVGGFAAIGMPSSMFFGVAAPAQYNASRINTLADAAQSNLDLRAYPSLHTRLKQTLRSHLRQAKEDGHSESIPAMTALLRRLQ